MNINPNPFDTSTDIVSVILVRGKRFTLTTFFFDVTADFVDLVPIKATLSSVFARMMCHIVVMAAGVNFGYLYFTR